MSNKLKLVTTTDSGTEANVPFIIKNGDEHVIYDGETPALAYYKDGQTFYALDKGGSEVVGIVTCSDLKDILDEYMFKGTKYIASTYNPTLYYLFPGVTLNDSLFKTKNNFIPTLPISNLVRLEVDGFSKTDSVTSNDLRCMKACDSWFNDLSKYEEIVAEIEERVEDIFGYYKNFNVEKEISDDLGRYSADLSEEPLVVSLISGTTYTDTINLEDWVLSSKKGTHPISGKLDISYMYSYGGSMYAGMQTIKAFQYEENVTSKNIVINQGEGCPVQIEYMDNVLKIYPLYDAVEEVVFTDCTLTIGVL